jgi:hypothetical protein
MEKVTKLVVLEKTPDVKWFLEFAKNNSISFSGWARKVLSNAIVDFNLKNGINTPKE